MNFIHSIKFRFTLWYLAVLSILLILLASGVYLTLAQVLHRNLDNSIRDRAEQLSKFRDIISIVAGGTFEEEIGEFISFYFYSKGQLRHISHKKTEIPLEKELIDLVLSGKSVFSTINDSKLGKLRIFAMPFTPDNPYVRPEKFSRQSDDIHRRQERDTRPHGDQERRPEGFERPRDDEDRRPERFERPRGDEDRRSERFERPRGDEDRRSERFERPRDDQDRRPERFERSPDGQDRRPERLERSPDNERRRPERFERPPNDRHDKRERSSRLENSQQMVEIRSAALIIARPAKDIETALERLLEILMIAIPLTLLFAGGGGVFLAKRAFKPVEQITNTAREIEEKDLSRRIDVHTKDELGRLASTLNQMIGRLERAFDRQKQFTSDASHELRAPLAVIQAESTLALQKDREKNEYQKILETITQETEHMSAVINQLLTLARADAGKERLKFEKFNLTVFMQDICADMEILCSEKDLMLKLNFRDQLIINGDKRSLKRLIHNLLNNAIKYTPKGGTLTVTVQRQEKMAVVSITDTGIGIPSHELPFIFERFYRVDKARSRNEKGSGLGLAICKHIVDIHGGSLEVESQLEKGSTFHVRLPSLK